MTYIPASDNKVPIIRDCYFGSQKCGYRNAPCGTLRLHCKATQLGLDRTLQWNVKRFFLSFQIPGCTYDIIMVAMEPFNLTSLLTVSAILRNYVDVNATNTTFHARGTFSAQVQEPLPAANLTNGYDFNNTDNGQQMHSNFSDVSNNRTSADSVQSYQNWEMASMTRKSYTALITIMSVVVIMGTLFTLFGLFMKASAFAWADRDMGRSTENTNSNSNLLKTDISLFNEGF